MKQIEDLNFLAQSFKAPTSPVCIPSYKLRKNCLPYKLETFKDLPVFLFIYENDYSVSGYDKLNLTPNTTIVKLTVDENTTDVDVDKLTLPKRSIRIKRRFIQKYMERLNYTRYFMLDDDLSHTGKITDIDPLNTRKSYSIPLYELLGRWEQYHTEHHLHLSGLGNSMEVCGPKKVFTNQQRIIQAYLIDKDWFKNKEVYFLCRDDLNNDLCFSYDCIKAGGNPVKLNFISCSPIYSDGINSTTSYLQKHKISTIGTIKYCEGHVTLEYKEDKNLKLTTKWCYNKVDKELMELIQMFEYAELNVYDELVKHFHNELYPSSMEEFFD